MDRNQEVGLPTIGPKGFVEGTNSFVFQGKEEHTFSDRISETGLLLIYPEFAPVKEEVRQFVRFGITIDNLMDEEPNAKINGLSTPNIDRFNLLRENLISRYETKPEILESLAGFIYQLWSVESESRKNQTIENPEKIQEYRELSNAIWTRMCVSFAQGIHYGKLDPVGKLGLESNLTKNTIPTYEELKNSQPINTTRLWIAYRGFIKGDIHDRFYSEENDPKARVLFLFLMAAANVYDNQGKTINEKLNTPGFTTKTTKYEKELKNSLGNTPSLLNALFTLMNIMVAARIKSRKNKQS